jgi:hypothetical protein
MSLETLQIVIVASLSISTILITVIGVQLILLIKELRTTVKRVNYVANGFAHISKSLEKSLTEVNNLAGGAKFVTGLISRIISRKDSSAKK